MLRTFFLLAQPPLLARRGDGWSAKYHFLCVAAFPYALLPVSTIEAGVISFNERAPQPTIARRSSLLRISITRSTPCCPNAERPQMYGRPIPAAVAPTASAL